MKNLTKIFVAVAVLFASFACTTDTTEDLGVNGLGQTTITLSLESSRTQLGEKEGDLYPVYWSEGDQISVNGVASNALTAEQAGSTSAEFTVNGTHETFNIAYPAAEANQVLFAATQVHTSNSTFANGAATLYGVGSAKQRIELHHLTGVLKIGVTGSATLTHAQISTVDRTPIAGAFNIDFTNGEVAPSTSAVSTINYSFGEGVALSSAATYIHVAVPAGEYDEMYVTLYDTEGGVMYTTVKAGESRPLNAGSIREFSNNIAYDANASVFVIKDKESLKAFAAEAATSNKDAIFVADVDMTDEAWTPIEGYTGTINGNGYAINGLTAPLFGTTSASIKGLHLLDLDITVASGAAVGAFANTYNGSLISHCSTSGKLEIKELNVSSGIGGFVGKTGTDTIDCRIDNCVNNCSITVSASCKETAISGIGGFVGIASSNSGSLTLSNNKNNAAISANGSMAERVCLSGNVGFVDLVPIYINDYHNSGTISVNFTSSSDVNVGGVWGRLYRSTEKYHAVAESCSNSGAINIATTTANDLAIGGCFGVTYFGSSKIATQKFDNCDNSGVITIGGESAGIAYVGGICGYFVGFPEIKNCDNFSTGAINYGPKSTSGQIFLAGLSGYYRHHIASADYGTTITDCNNYADIKSTKGCAGYYGCGGIIGYLYSSTIYKMGLYNVNNYGSITISGADEGGSSKVYLGGLVACAIKGFSDSTSNSVLTFSNCHNYSTQERPSVMKITNGDYADIFSGGIIGYSYARMNVENCSNSQPLTIDANKIGSTANGAMCGKLVHQGAKLTSNVKNFSNTADFHIKPNIMSNVVASMFLGYFNSSGDQQHMYMVAENVTNSGDLNIYGNSTSACYYGGICGYARLGRTKLTMTNAANTGDISVGGTISGNLLVGGLIGTHTATLVFTNVINEGDVTVDITSTSTETDMEYLIGGLIGNQMGSLTEIGCYNKGDVSVTGTLTGAACVGGNVASLEATISLENSGNSGAISIGSDTKACSASKLCVGGIAGSQEAEKTCTFKSGIVNIGDISIVNLKNTDVANSYVGGIFGYALYPIDGASCYCDIMAAGYTNVGWIMGSPRANGTVVATNCKIGGVLVDIEVDEEDESKTEKRTPLTTDNYYKYIYSNGANTDWTGVENYDGCTLLSEKPAI